MSNIEFLQLSLIVIVVFSVLYAVVNHCAIIDLREQVAELHEKRVRLQKELERLKDQFIEQSESEK